MLKNKAVKGDKECSQVVWDRLQFLKIEYLENSSLKIYSWKELRKGSLSIGGGGGKGEKILRRVSNRC